MKAAQARLLKREIVEFIRARMPWPYVDVDRDSTEAREAAAAIAAPVFAHLSREFTLTTEELRRAPTVGHKARRGTKRQNPAAVRAGYCRFCGCSAFDPCPAGCAWADSSYTVCSACIPARDAETSAIKEAGITKIAGGQRARLAGFIHRGFVAGWFAVTGRLGQNPERPGTTQWDAWDLGRAAGLKARRLYLREAPGDGMPNGPREFILNPDAASRRRADERRADSYGSDL